jgi:hypothetical protein
MTKSCAANMIGKSSWHWVWTCRSNHARPWKQLAQMGLSWFVWKWDIPLVDHHSELPFGGYGHNFQTHTHWWHQVLIARVYVLSAHHLNWLVVYEPLWKIWVRELGWWHSQLNGKIIQMFQTTNQIKSNTRLVVEDSAIRTNRRMILAGFRTRIDSLAQMEVSPTNIGI